MNKSEDGTKLKDWFMKQPDYGFKNKALSEETKLKFTELGRIVRGDILTMTTVASSGHPGGAVSSADLFIVVYSLANTVPGKVDAPKRDRIVVSHGHTSAGVYSILGRLGFFDIEDVLANFRKCGSIFEGHVERDVPGCEWTTGNLGQGLSAGCGFALASKINKRDYNVFVIMGDAEQAKGQVSEARRFAKQFNLNNITAVIDYNELQISGSSHKVMNVNIKDDYIADGWKVIEVDGHNYGEIYGAIRESIEDTKTPVVIICHTIMGESVSFMEKAKEYYHGRPLTIEKCKEAFEELNIPLKVEFYKEKRENTASTSVAKNIEFGKPTIETGEAFNYSTEDRLGNRDAFGRALENIARINRGKDRATPIVALDCDLKESVRTHLFEKVTPEWFIECGVAEHNAAVIGGVLSIEGAVTFWADFGVFGLDEVYNQQRLNAINHTNLKVVITHSGINVGEDGKTHQCIDYLGLSRNFPNFKVIIPADPNQTDRVIRFVVKEKGNFLIVTGRSKNSVITSSSGKPFFANSYAFNYGKVDVLREGDKGVIMTYGPMVTVAINAYEELKREGVELSVWNVSSPLALSREDVEGAILKGPIFTFEDHLVNSGLGTIVGGIIADTGMGTIFRKIGVRAFAPSGAARELYKAIGMDEKALVREIKKTMNGER